ncbi:bifunctional metallophosphatase/5'-nucleotidase [Deltaproteobacteria bacterium]|nr:bifunctional metallophosphatase/5'-nucleotidase [Deltaproteobacteria bacterium]
MQLEVAKVFSSLKRLSFLFLSVFFLYVLIISISTFDKITFAADTESVRIITTNDIHTYLKPLYYRYLDDIKPWGTVSREGDYINKAKIEGKIGGMAYVATMIKKLRAEKPGKNLLLDAGDTWHGGGISFLDKGVSMVKVMNAIGYDAMVPGNWEFFYNNDHFLDLIESAKFPVIAFNLTDKDWEEPVLDQYIIRKIGKLKIAVIGFTYPWTALTSAATGAAKMYNFGIKEDAARELLSEIRKKEDPDLVILISHGGFGLDQKFAKRVSGIDVLLSGHTHDEVADPVVWNNTIVFQGGAHGKYVVSLDLDVKNKKVVDFEYRLNKVMQKRIKPDPKVSKLIEQAYRPHKSELSKKIGKSGSLLHRRDFWQSTLGNLITDVMRETHRTDIAFFPAWRFGASLLPGEITKEDIYNIIPTQGHVFTFSMRGKELRNLLENIISSVVNKDPYTRVGGDMIRFSGMKLICDITKPTGKRIIKMSVGGKEFSEDTVYRISSAHSRFQNNPLFGATHVKDTGKKIVEELINYIEREANITSSLDDRIKVLAFE